MFLWFFFFLCLENIKNNIDWKKMDEIRTQSNEHQLKFDQALTSLLGNLEEALESLEKFMHEGRSPMSRSGTHINSRKRENKVTWFFRCSRKCPFRLRLIQEGENSFHFFIGSQNICPCHQNRIIS